MTDIILEFAELIFQIAVLAFVFVRSVTLIRRNGNSVVPVFFCFGILAFLISDFYWMAHSLMLPEVRIPFAVNLMGENSISLLFSALLIAVYGKGKIKPGIEMMFTALFAVASTTIWIAYSGEWLKDILSGIVYGYFLCVTIGALKVSQALTKREWASTALVSFSVIGMQVLMLFTKPQIASVFDTLSIAILFMAFIYFTAKTLYILKNGKDSGKLVSLAFFCFAWITSTMYMSTGRWYIIASIACSLDLILLLVSVRRKVEAQ